MATTVTIDDEASATLTERLAELQTKARRAGLPTRPINKGSILSELIKTAFGSKKRPPRPQSPEAQPRGE